MEKTQTVERSQSCRRPSVDALVREHSQPLRLWLSSRVPRHELDNASQEVWLRVSKYYEVKFDGNNFRAWLFQIARNYLIDASRRRRLTPVPDETELVRPDQRTREPYEILIDRERRSHLAACIERLGEPRKAIVKARAAGLGYDEFAAELNLSNQQASQYFFKARTQLRECLESCTVEAI
jgi:RNA polymerase sigma-70 factor (ECF subfamily)